VVMSKGPMEKKAVIFLSASCTDHGGNCRLAMGWMPVYPWIAVKGSMIAPRTENWAFCWRCRD